ncbi:MAG: anaerobic ribonucleoside triphosphate reductase [Tissierellia bacterium]|nr:anaerobic ribonucleoside triphosphate reductase [Tissierellia bacterium]
MITEKIISTKKILKRDGRVAEFDINKIENAIFKAALSQGGNDFHTASQLAIEVSEIADRLYKDVIPSVEDIQDIVEKVLIENGHARTAKSYILYRAERNRVRNSKSRLMKVYEDLTFKSAKDVDIKRENANIDGDTAMGMMLRYGSEGAKEFNYSLVLNPLHSAAHISGDIHIHDLDFLTLTTTCCQIDLTKLFNGGFNTGNGSIREPNDIATYAALTAIAIQANQNDQHGGQSIPNFDYALANGVKKTYRKMYFENLIKAIELETDLNYSELDELYKSMYSMKETPSILDSDEFLDEERKLLLNFLGSYEKSELVKTFAKRHAIKDTRKKTYQAMEALIHNLNTMHSRAGAQIPFSSINYGTDTSPEGRMVVEELLKATEAGLGNGETPIFPIQIFKVKEGINYNSEDPNYDLFKLAIKVSSKRLFPNFSFLDAPFNKAFYKEGKPETEIAYMGCRTRVIANVYDKNREIVTGRGNLSFTTINLPRIAINNRGDVEGFFKELDKKTDLVIAQLLERFEIQAKKKVRNFPFLMGQGIWIDSDKLDVDDEIREVIKHGTLTIGFIGLAEALVGLIGKHHGESEEAESLGLEVISFLRNKADKACERYQLNFSLIATPAEGTSGTLVQKDKIAYGIIEGITDKEYYTNSFHIPVGYKIKAIDKIKKEAPFHSLTNGGHISYVELDGNASNNLDAFETIVRAMKENDIGYGSINHPVDRDTVCGYNGIIGDTCPNCGRLEGDIPFERIRRITGYLVGTLDRFNNAKRAEERDRIKHGL